uniref:Uncharacterized protein n=1 Tax=Favella ehrenbergii TaxID=182087 RepID=A0A7S3MK64_9SPIT
MVQAQTANRLKLSILDRLKDGITRDMLEVQRLHCSETATRWRALRYLKQRIEVLKQTSADVRRARALELIELNLESEENENGVLTRASEEYEEALEQGGIDALLELLTTDEKAEHDNWLLAEF